MTWLSKTIILLFTCLMGVNAMADSAAGANAIFNTLLYGIPMFNRPAGSSSEGEQKKISGQCKLRSPNLSDRPCPQTKIELLDQNRTLVQSTWTDASGTFTFFAVPKGKYFIDPGFSNYQVIDNGQIKPGMTIAMVITD